MFFFVIKNNNQLRRTNQLWPWTGLPLPLTAVDQKQQVAEQSQLPSNGKTKLIPSLLLRPSPNIFFYVSTKEFNSSDFSKSRQGSRILLLSKGRILLAYIFGIILNELRKLCGRHLIGKRFNCTITIWINLTFSMITNECSLNISSCCKVTEHHWVHLFIALCSFWQL